MESLREHGRLLTAFVRSPAITGAVAPCSRELGVALVEGMPLHRARTVVELGPGTGRVTRVIQERVGHDTRFLAVEVDADLARRLALRCVGVEVIHASAERLAQLLRDRGSTTADCIVSGLPWSAFGDDLQNRLLDVVWGSLATGGRFSTVAYLTGCWLPRGRHFRRRLERRFASVRTTPVVWGNLPPAFVYTCRA